MPKPRLRIVAALAAALFAGCYSPTVLRQKSYHPSDADLTLTRIVHSSFVADFGTTRILVDPWFSASASVGQREPIGLPLDRIPGVRGILITHEHTDHFDRETLRNYADKTIRVVTVRGLGAEIRQMGYVDVVEVGPWEDTQIGAVILRAVPASHGVEEVGYVLQANGVVAYLAGDTLFDGEQFAAIARAFPSIDVAVLPVGGVRVAAARLDMNAEEAAEAARILRPRRVVPSHYGLTGPFPFVLANADAAADFFQAVKATGSDAQVVTLEPGESWHYYR